MRIELCYLVNLIISQSPWLPGLPGSPQVESADRELFPLSLSPSASFFSLFCNILVIVRSCSGLDVTRDP
jgi:hypothetical protein